MIETSRRSLLVGLGGIIAAPAIVRASSLMKVKVFDTRLPTMPVISTHRTRYLGLAQLKQEGMPCDFDAWNAYSLRHSFNEFKEIVAAEILNRT